MTDALRLTVVYDDVEDGWVQARVRELPSVITAAPSHDEAQAAVLDALEQYLKSFGSDSDATTSGQLAPHEEQLVLTPSFLELPQR